MNNGILVYTMDISVQFHKKAEKDFEKHVKDPFFMLGLGILGIEKGRRIDQSIQFSTPDTQVMSLLLDWIEKYLETPKKSLTFRLFIAKNHSNSNFEQNWA